MSCKIFTLKEFEKWKEKLSLLPKDQQDVYYRPEYYSLYENNGDGIAQCFCFEEDGNIAMYPFLINSVNKLGYELDKEYFDIQGAYGYNGIVASSKNKNFLNSFYAEFDKYCLEKNIIAEFTRFNPVTENHIFEKRIAPVYALDNVLIDISLDIDDIWMKSFDNGVRKAVKKGIRNNLVYKEFLGSEISQEYYQAFLDIYFSTMDRNSADSFYYFSKDYFNNLKDNLPQNILFSFVEYEGKIVSTELNLINVENSYGFLGGTLRDYFKYSPNSFLRFELIKSLIERGIINYSIGGGITKDDSKYKFKKSFSKQLDNKFYIGKVIHNKDIYNQVVNNYDKAHPEVAKVKLLRYRE